MIPRKIVLQYFSADRVGIAFVFFIRFAFIRLSDCVLWRRQVRL